MDTQRVLNLNLEFKQTYVHSAPKRHPNHIKESRSENGCSSTMIALPYNNIWWNTKSIIENLKKTNVVNCIIK